MELGGSGTGATMTDWNTAANWNPAFVPTSCFSAIIAATANQPIVSTTCVAACYNLTVNTNATLTIQSSSGSGLLSIYGSLTNNGTINYTNTTQSSTNHYVNLRSTDGTGTISGATGAYTNMPVTLLSGSRYTVGNKVSLSNLWLNTGSILTLGTGCDSLKITTGNISSNVGINLSGKWSLGSAVVCYSGYNAAAGSYTSAPPITSTNTNFGTSTFYYNTLSGYQYVTDANYYQLKSK